MSLISSCECFPPDPNYLFLLTITYNFDESIHPQSESKGFYRCQRCSAYKLRKEDICPICKPLAYSTISNDVDFAYFKVRNIKKEPCGKLVFILLDLSLSDELDTFADFLRNEIEETDLLFVFVFLGETITFLTIANESKKIMFNAMKTVVNTSSFARPISNWKNGLKDAFRVANIVLKKCNDSTNDNFKELITFLNKNGTLPDINNIIYLFKSNVPKIEDFELNMLITLIKVQGNSNQEAIDLACNLRAKYYFVNGFNNKCFENIFKSALSKDIRNKKIEVFRSNGIAFKDYSGPIISVSKDNTIQTFKTYYCASQDPLYLIPTCDNKSGYNDNSFFTVQVALSFYEDYIYVINGVWKKNTKINDWTSYLLTKETSDILFLTLIRKKAFGIFQSYSKSKLSKFVIPNRQVKINNEGNLKYLKAKITALENLLVTLFKTQNDLFDSGMKLNILKEFIIGDSVSLNIFANTFLRLKLDSKVTSLLIPPYQFTTTKENVNPSLPKVITSQIIISTELILKLILIVNDFREQFFLNVRK